MGGSTDDEVGFCFGDCNQGPPDQLDLAAGKDVTFYAHLAPLCGTDAPAEPVLEVTYTLDGGASQRQSYRVVAEQPAEAAMRDFYHGGVQAGLRASHFDPTTTPPTILSELVNPGSRSGWRSPEEGDPQYC